MAASSPVPSFDLGGQVALITGAVRGIGAAIARAAAAAGLAACGICGSDLHAVACDPG